MTFNQFINHWYRAKWPDEWRIGQSLFNALHEARPDLAKRLVGKSVDPFYRDHNTGNALVWIEENW